MKIGIVGCAGRMGRMLLAEVISTDGCTLAGGTEQPGNPVIGTDPADLIGVDSTGLAIVDDAATLFEAADVVIDFTLPVATIGHAELAAAQGTALVIGTTGLDDAQQGALQTASAKCAIVQAANFSLGVNLLLGLTQQVAGLLDEEFDIEIVEMHHRHKVDAPSGTALALGRSAAAGRGVDLDAVAETVRSGHTGERKPGEIGFATLRGGDVVGDHTVLFAAEGERIEITHKASSRAIFARGAVRAANWTAGKAPGMYAMGDVLGFS